MSEMRRGKRTAFPDWKQSLQAVALVGAVVDTPPFANEKAVCKRLAAYLVGAVDPQILIVHTLHLRQQACIALGSCGQ